MFLGQKPKKQSAGGNYRVRARDARIRVMHAEHQISVLTLQLQPPLALPIWIQSYQRLNFLNCANQENTSCIQKLLLSLV
jgi:hypothetical protein